MEPSTLAIWSLTILLTVVCACASAFPVLCLLNEFFGKPREWDDLHRHVWRLEERIKALEKTNAS